MVEVMRRHCGRPGCSALATTTFSFDATRCVVWLNPISEGTPRAGDLCTRHADTMAPPKGWERVDRRHEPDDSDVARSDIGAPNHSIPVANPTPHNDFASPQTLPTPAPTSATTKSTRGEENAPDDVDDLLPSKGTPKRKRKKRWDEVPSLFESSSPLSTTTPAPSVASNKPELPPPTASTSSDIEGRGGIEEVIVPWLPRFATDDDLDGVLDASTPLLARAFRNARPTQTSEQAAEERNLGRPPDPASGAPQK